MSLAIDWLKPKTGQDPMNFLDDVFRYARAGLGQREEAEDIAIEVVQALPNPCHRRDLRQYMLGMARRKIADRLRRQRPAQDLKEKDLHTRFDSKSDEKTLVAAAMERLATEHREVLVLKYIVGMTSAEVGRVLAKRADAVDSMLQRAREAFSQVWTSLSSEEVIP